MSDKASDVGVLEAEIARNRETLTACTDGHPDHAAACDDLADSLWRMHAQTGNMDTLNEAIVLGRKVLALHSGGDPDRATACSNLAVYLWTAYEQTSNADLLTEAIAMEREALVLLPDDHLDRTTLCSNLAASLLLQYEQTSDPDLLDEAIMLERQALKTHPDRHPRRAASCGNLAESLKSQYEQTGDTALLDEAVDLGREALALCPNGHPQRAVSCGALSVSLKLCYDRTGNPGLLDEAIALEREALSLRPEGHPYHASSSGNLATYLKQRYEQTGDDTLVDEAITLERKALVLWPDGHSERSTSYENLAISLSLRYEKTGDASLLDEAISLEREALALRGISHPNPALSYSNLSSYLMLRYKQDGGAALLGEAVTLEYAALDLRPDGHPHRATSCGNLGLYLSLQYRQTGELALLDKAIVFGRESLSLRSEGSPDRALSCENLANCLCLLYQQTGNDVLLDEAITLEREALALRPNNHPHRAMSCGNIAIYLSLRYRQTGHVSMLEEAITWGHESLSLCGVGHPERAASCGNLAHYYSMLAFDRTSRNDSFDEVFKLEREALSLRPGGHPNRAISCGNLARYLGASYQKTGHIALLDEAIELEREALALRPSGYINHAAICIDLATLLRHSYTETKNAALLEESLELLKESVTSSPPSVAWRPQDGLSKLRLQRETPFFSISAALYSMRKVSDMPVDVIQHFIHNVGITLELLWSCRDVWDDDVPSLLACIYSSLIDRLPSLAGHVLDASSQLSALGFVGSMGSDACISALLAQNPAQALELLDRAHGVMWAQALRLRDPQLKDVPENLAHELESLLRAVNGSAAGDPGAPQLASTQADRHLTSLDIRHQQNSRIQAIFREVRAMPGLERFMLGSTFEQLREVARSYPVVVLVAARGYAYALIMSGAQEGEPHALPLIITSAQVSSLRDNAGRAGLRDTQIAADNDLEEDTRMGMYKSSAGSKTNTDPLVVLSDIWIQIVKPVLECLQLEPLTGRDRPRLHWCPTSDFAFLPLHAAGVYDGPYHRRTTCSDYVVSSYIHTLSALLRAQTKPPHVAPSHIHVLAIAEDTGTSKMMRRLWNVDQELTRLEYLAKTSSLDCAVEPIPKGATVDRVTTRIPSAHFVHLACHGTQDPTAPLESGFHLSDGMLTVSKLMSLDLKPAWFAYLSACETAKGDAKQPDQGVHLAAAMLFAGFKCVVATRWSIRDVDGPDVAQWFYEELLSNEEIDADAVAYALDHAVRKLREKIPREPERWAPYIHMGA